MRRAPQHGRALPDRQRRTGRAGCGRAPQICQDQELTRTRALRSRVRHGYVQREIRETGHEHVGPVEGVRCVITGHAPVPEPTWHENVLGIDTGVHITERGYGRLTIARIDTKEIETWSFERVAEDDIEESV